ncbi:hypothetical protein phD2B_0027 [Lelliottia phage phD2B]|uniref:Uncharacterized protein n=1 Tax=Lelliottia phage phD2B TaxID=1542498 RepID=A0A088FS34_9CAUD|nr:hypothetical protein phD2B_0027 [Lelliottia phage phD2B]AIM51253.1 hypothetical protein phD2B_0027 [Lelliottia phage phD2B]
MEKTKTKPQINQAGYDMLEQHILKASHPSVTKKHDELVWDECKRHILACINQQFQVTH